MLVAFTVENFLSFDQETEFSMVAGNSTNHPNHCVTVSNQAKIQLLKMGVIYGANASGKSNFVKALDFARDLVVHGFNSVSFEKKYFRLDKNNAHKDTKFEFQIKLDTQIYAYGFVLRLTTQTLKEEWLVEVGESEDKPIFERTVLENGKSEISINLALDSNTANRFSVYQQDVKNNQLFLTELNNKNLEDIANIEPITGFFRWLKKQLRIVFPESKYAGIDFIGRNDTMSNLFTPLLVHFNTGISGISTQELDFDKTMDKLPEEIKTQLLTDMVSDTAMEVRIEGERFSLFRDKDNEVKIARLNTQHTLKNSNEHENFNLKDESDGTRRLFDLIPLIIDTIKSPKTYIVDEIDRSLHPELTQKFLQMFIANTTNNNSQLIITTHESNLLDAKLLRNDEIWFTEKNKEGATKLYSLEEFKPQHNNDIEKAYLQGRFGAIPFIADTMQLNWSN